nr:thymidylate synthase [uncultured bacterium]AIA17851.1 thymidylate synthase [uncultured bacterium]
MRFPTMNVIKGVRLKARGSGLGGTMKQYLEHAVKILSDKYTGYKPNRTGIDTISRFGHENEYDLSEGLPLLTTKKLFSKGIIHELIWFMRGDTNLKYLVDNNVRIWDEWGYKRYLQSLGKDKEITPNTPAWDEGMNAYRARIKSDENFAKDHGELGPVYGRQWRKWEGPNNKVVDQFGDLINGLKKSPSSRRLIVSAWNPIEVPNMALPPCHTIWHVNVQDKDLTLKLYQRSCDMFLGVPFNIASYAMLAHVLAQEANLNPGRFVHSFGDAHFYCGKGERGAWYGKNLDELKERVRNVETLETLEGYLDVKDWIERNAPPEPQGYELMDHIPLILEQLSREEKPLPTLQLAAKPYDQLTVDDFKIENYNPHPAIKGKVAV